MITQRNSFWFAFVVAGSLLIGIWLFATNCGPKPAPPPATATPIATTAATMTPGPAYGPVAPEVVPSPTFGAYGSGGLLEPCRVRGSLPDVTLGCTPGAVLPVTAAQVCKRGYAASVRNVPESEKEQVFREYGIFSHPPGAYEVDHLISLELGGSNDISNLWPEAAEPHPGFHEKDAVENMLHAQVCSGKISLADAQKEIATNWLAVYQEMKP